MRMKASEILIKAKGLLNAHPRAWIKMTLWNSDPVEPAYCAMGAMHSAISGKQFGQAEVSHCTPEVQRAGKLLTEAASEVAIELGRPLNEAVRGDRLGRSDPAYFNDTAESQDEVNKMFCRAIDKAVTEELRAEPGQQSKGEEKTHG